MTDFIKNTPSKFFNVTDDKFIHTNEINVLTDSIESIQQQRLLEDYNLENRLLPFYNQNYVNSYLSYKVSDTEISSGCAYINGDFIKNNEPILYNNDYSSTNTVYKLKPVEAYKQEGYVTSIYNGTVIGSNTKFTKVFRGGAYANYIKLSTESNKYDNFSGVFGNDNIYKVLDVVSDTELRIQIGHNVTYTGNKSFASVSYFTDGRIPLSSSKYISKDIIGEIVDSTELNAINLFFVNQDGIRYDIRNLDKTDFQSSQSTMPQIPIIDYGKIICRPHDCEDGFYELQIKTKYRYTFGFTAGGARPANTFAGSLYSGCIMMNPDTKGVSIMKSGIDPTLVYAESYPDVSSGLFDMDLFYNSPFIYIKAYSEDGLYDTFKLDNSVEWHKNNDHSKILLPTCSKYNLEFSLDGETYYAFDTFNVAAWYGTKQYIDGYGATIGYSAISFDGNVNCVLSRNLKNKKEVVNLREDGIVGVPDLGVSTTVYVKKNTTDLFLEYYLTSANSNYTKRSLFIDFVNQEESSEFYLNDISLRKLNIHFRLKKGNDISGVTHYNLEYIGFVGHNGLIVENSCAFVSLLEWTGGKTNIISNAYGEGGTKVSILQDNKNLTEVIVESPIEEGIGSVKLISSDLFNGKKYPGSSLSLVDEYTGYTSAGVQIDASIKTIIKVI